MVPQSCSDRQTSKIKEKYNVDYFEYVENGTQLEVSLDEEDYNIYKEYIVEE
jgi:GTP-binding protein HflX